MRITITIGDEQLRASLLQSAASRDMLDQAPLSIDMSDHGGVEKTGPLPSSLFLEGHPTRQIPDVGELGSFVPGNDLVRYYGDQSYHPGLVILGLADGDAAQRIAEMDATSTAALEANGV
jgi:hypothetical protein